MQHSYSIQNQAGAAFRADLNDALTAIVSNNSGPEEPNPSYAFQWWADTTSGILKQRNAANNDWIEILYLATGLPVAGVTQTSTTGALLLAQGDNAKRPAPEDIPDGLAAVRSNSENPADPFIESFNKHTSQWERFVTSGFALPALVKTDPEAPCLIKTSATTLAIKAGSHVKIGVGYVSLVAQTTVTMPAVLTPGEDYAVFVHPDGAASAVADPFFAPAAAPVLGALKIGGFHYGLVAPGTTPASGGFATTGFTNSGGNYPWTQARVDRIAGINEFSIWDLTHRSKGEQHGFAFDPARKVWAAIYFCSPDHITNGISRYNTPVASGTVLPKIPVGDDYCGDGVMTYGRFTAYEAVEILSSHGCRLITEDEFISVAFGVTEKQSLGGAASTIPATKREPGYTSRIGLEQATGHIWTIGGPLTSVGGSAWAADPGRGSLYGTSGLPLFGGNRADAASSGSRASYWSGVFWDSHWTIGLRAACDHYQGGI